MPDLVIRMNPVASNDPCAVCGDRTDPLVGPELFLANTYHLVCRRCGQQLAPELVAVLDTAQAARADGAPF